MCLGGAARPAFQPHLCIRIILLFVCVPACTCVCVCVSTHAVRATCSPAEFVHFRLCVCARVRV